MPKYIYLYLAVAITALTLSHDAVAQPDGNGESRFMMHLNDQVFVWNPEIAGMLDLTSEQRDGIQKVVQEYQTQSDRRQRFMQGQDAGDSKDSDSSPQPPIKAFEQLFMEMRAGINQVLQPEQRAKFGGITFQLAGGLDSLSVNNQMLEHVLDLTPEQKEQIRKIVADRKIAYTTNPEIIKKSNDLIKAVAKSEQWTKLEKLTAEIPALRKELKMPDQTGRTQTQVPQEPARPQSQSPEYVPGADSWRPGMPLPEGMVSPPPPPQRRSFPRSESN
jgi:Spy/CpxP family protein refolding chaperone